MGLRPIGTRYTNWIRPEFPVKCESQSSHPAHAKRVVWEVIAHEPTGEVIRLVESVMYRARLIRNTVKDTWDWELVRSEEIVNGYYEPIRFVNSEIDYTNAVILEKAPTP